MPTPNHHRRPAIHRRPRHTARPCDCPLWTDLDPAQQARTLARLTQWARLFYHVRISLTRHDDNHVTISELSAPPAAEPRVRKVLEQVCLWADRVHLTLEVTPAPTATHLYPPFGFLPHPGTTTLVRHPLLT